MPYRSLWSQESAYDYWDDLPLEGLAWEFLRRNSDYQTTYKSGSCDASAWGLRIPANPDNTALDVPVHWAPSLTSSELVISSLPLPTTPQTVRLDAPQTRDGEDATFGIIGVGASELRLSFIDASSPPDAALCVVIPLDSNLPDRIESLQRLWRILHNRPAPDQRISRDKRRRLQHIARASDGRAQGASSREIATELFGEGRVETQDWRTSSLRYTTLRLLRDGKDMIAGGYRDLLHSGRNTARKMPPSAPSVRT